MFFLVGLVLFGFPGREHVHAPENRRQADQQGHVGHVVDQRVDQHFLAGPAFGAEDKGEDQVAHARAIGHDQRAQHGAFDSALAHRLEPPDHQEGSDHEEAEEKPRRPRAGAFDPCNERFQGAQSGKGVGPRQGGFGIRL